MKRQNLFIIGLLTAVITMVSLNLIFGRSNWANERAFTYSHWGQHRGYCNDDGDLKTERTKEVERLRSDTAHY